LESLEGLPEGLETLYLDSMPSVGKLSVLPDHLAVLGVSRSTDIEAIPFRSSLKRLQIGDTRGYQVYTPDGQDLIPDRRVKTGEEYFSLLAEYETFMEGRKKSAYSADPRSHRR